MAASLVGDKDGIKLWQIMSKSNDVEEKKYYADLLANATKHHVVWFTDIVTRRETGKTQTFWELGWDGKNWRISMFQIPQGAKKTNDRIENFGKEEILILTEDDIIETV